MEKITGRIKTITIKEPWASLILEGKKTIETRTWKTNYRGPLLLHASKEPKSVISGKIFAIAELTDCRPMTKEDEQAAQCDIYENAFSWILTNIRPYGPLEIKGQQGLFETDLDNLEGKETIKIQDLEKIKLEYRNINEIKPYKFNPRKNQKAISVVADSIRQFGFLVPVVIDQNDELIAGHTRIEAAKILGLTEVPTIKVENLTEEQIRAFRIMDNKSTEYANWDRILLRHEFEFLRDKIDMKYTGFREAEIHKIMGEQTKDPRGNKLGKYQIEPMKVYILGKHRLICGDATQEETYLKLIPPKTEIHCVYTDPPYGVSYRGTNNENGREWDIIQGDKLRGEDLFELLSKAFKNVNQYLAKDAALYIFHASANQTIFERALNYAGFKVKQQLIWEKHHVLGHSHYHWNHEPIFYCSREEENPKYYGTRDNTTVMDILKITEEQLSTLDKEQLLELLKIIIQNSTMVKINQDATTKYLHPTQKPSKLAEHYILNSSKQEENILDMFAGSGSTLIACENKNRRCFCVEIDPNFCSHIIERWEDFTGNHATDELKKPLTLR